MPASSTSSLLGRITVVLVTVVDEENLSACSARTGRSARQTCRAWFGHRARACYSCQRCHSHSLGHRARLRCRACGCWHDELGLSSRVSQWPLALVASSQLDGVIYSWPPLKGTAQQDPRIINHRTLSPPIASFPELPYLVVAALDHAHWSLSSSSSTLLKLARMALKALARHWGSFEAFPSWLLFGKRWRWRWSIWIV